MNISVKFIIITNLLMTCLLACLSAIAGVVTAETAITCTSIEYYYTQDCPHCKRATEFFNSFEPQYPEILIKRYNVHQDLDAITRFIELHERHGIERPGVPFIVMCDQYLIGFDEPETTGRMIEKILGLAEISSQATKPVSGQIELPVIGSVDVHQYGLPLLTIMIGLIDGFNPCAMWVLLFLLSLLVNLKNRIRIFLVAGVFVLVSGLVYFAFMATWLNFFLIIGFTRLLQVTVGLVAVFIGSVHVKDYFALGKGITLNIPVTAKPGLYARMRDVIYARNLWASLIAVTVLAIMVNMVELLCTAGLPAVYTQVLTSHELPTIKYYSYLLLYNAAYIFDDALMVGVVVYTLSRSKLQEKTGRILNFISGSVLLVLGICLLFFPQVLI